MALWGEEAAAEAVKAVRVHVSRIRAALGDPDALVTAPAGYQLRVAAGELDADRFEDLLEQGRRALADGARRARRSSCAPRSRCGEAASWPICGTRRSRRRRSLGWRSCAGTRSRPATTPTLELGRTDAVLAELERRANEAPLRERLVEQRMRALYAAGERVEALSVYREAQRRLDAELGLQPGPALRSSSARSSATTRRFGQARTGRPPAADDGDGWASGGPRGGRCRDRRPAPGDVDRTGRRRQDAPGRGDRPCARAGLPRRRPRRLPRPRGQRGRGPRRPDPGREPARSTRASPW